MIEFLGIERIKKDVKDFMNREPIYGDSHWREKKSLKLFLNDPQRHNMLALDNEAVCFGQFVTETPGVTTIHSKIITKLYEEYYKIISTTGEKSIECKELIDKVTKSVSDNCDDYNESIVKFLAKCVLKLIHQIGDEIFCQKYSTTIKQSTV